MMIVSSKEGFVQWVENLLFILYYRSNQIRYQHWKYHSIPKGHGGLHQYHQSQGQTQHVSRVQNTSKSDTKFNYRQSIYLQQQIIDEAKAQINQNFEIMRSQLKDQILKQKELNDQLVEKLIGYSQMKELYLKAPSHENIEECQQWKQFFNQLDKVVKHLNSNECNEFYVLCQSIKKQSQLLISLEGSKQLTTEFDKILSQLSQAQVQLSEKLHFEIRSDIDNSLLGILKSKSIFIQTILLRVNKQGQLNCLFHSSSDPLDYDIFINKLNGKNQLLMLIKVQSGEVMGAFIPQKYDNTLQFMPDTSCTSFIFSVLKQQIYPLKQERISNAIWCNGYLAYFGSNGDLDLSKKFIAQSTLNQAYDSSAYGTIDPQTHLLGAVSSAITQLEVYQFV